MNRSLRSAIKVDVHTYLLWKVEEVVNSVRKPGEAGWAFATLPISKAAIWSNGTKHSQSTPLDNTRGCSWWPS